VRFETATILVVGYSYWVTWNSGYTFRPCILTTPTTESMESGRKPHSSIVATDSPAATCSKPQGVGHKGWPCNPQKGGIPLPVVLGKGIGFEADPRIEVGLFSDRAGDGVE